MSATKIYNLFLMSTTNVGDELCSPVDYFEWPLDVEKVCVHHLSERAAEINQGFVIYGGGGHIHLPAPDYNNGIMGHIDFMCNLLTGPGVSWGIGHNVHGGDKVSYPKNFKDHFLLHGVRDQNQKELPWVPCASCMHPALKEHYFAKRDVAFVGHRLSELDFTKGRFTVDVTKEKADEVVRAIGESNVIVTNAYHAALWGSLLERKVIVFDPYSTKFSGLPQTVVLASPKTWESKLGTVRPSKGLLAKFRSRSEWYYEKVLELLDEV